jgi:formylmethanofuran dehydrogenase subunit C
MTDTSMITNIKRSDDSTSGLDSLFDYNASDVEHEKKVEAKEGLMKVAFAEFDRYITSNGVATNYSNDIVLLPKEINQVLQLTKSYSHDWNYQFYACGFFTSLLENSYNFGHNNFYLNLEDFPLIDYLCHGISSKRILSPMKIKIDGDVGSEFGFGSTDINIILNGFASNNFLEDSMYSKAIVLGNIGNSAFLDAKESSIFVKGNVGENFCSSSMESHAFLIGNAKRLFGSNSYSLNAIVLGDAIDDFCSNSKRGNIFIKGDVNDYAAYGAKDLALTIIGNAGTMFGYDSKGVSCVIDGNVGRKFAYKSDGLRGLISGKSGREFLEQSYESNAIKGESAKNNPKFKEQIDSFKRRLKRWQ